MRMGLCRISEMLKMKPASAPTAFVMRNQLRLVKDFDALKLGQNR